MLGTQSMKIKIYYITVLSIIYSIAFSQEEPDNIWIKADIQAIRLSPGAIPSIPKNIQEYLDVHNYTIPQDCFARTPNNVISGHFLDSIKIDLAILCSKDRFSAILIFWNCKADSVTELSRSADIYWLQSAGGDKIGYSRIISVASKSRILEHYDPTSDTHPIDITHDGIEDGFDGKCSEILYYNNGRLTIFSGAD